MMQGIPAGFALTAMANYLIAEGLSAQAVGKFVALVGLPWTFQFIWGPFIDRYQQSAMGRRRPWVLFSQTLAFLASLLLLFVQNAASQIELLTTAFFIHSVFASIQDASVDAMAITVTPVAERGRVNAFMRGGMLIGTSLGAVIMAYCIHRFGFQIAALAQSMLLLGFTLLTFCIRETKQDTFFSLSTTVATHAIGHEEETASVKLLFTRLFRALASPVSLRVFGVIAIVYTCLSIFIRAFNVHLIRELHWTDVQVSTLSGSYVALATLGVVFAGGILADRIGAQKLLVVVMLIMSLYLLIFNLLAPLWQHMIVPKIGLLVWYLFDPCFSIAAMPVLMNICRPGIEGSQFTTYMSLVNFCDVVGAYLSGYALLWVSAPFLGILCGLIIFTLLIITSLSMRHKKLVFQ